MIATLEKTVTIGMDKRITFDLSALEGISEGQAQVVLLVLNGAEKQANAVQVQESDTTKADAFAKLTQGPSTEEMLAEAEKIWAYNRAHPEEVKATLQRLRGSLSSSAFGGLDGVEYQRQIRDEWEDRLVKMGLSNNTD